jgi:hypothetical protein
MFKTFWLVERVEERREKKKQRKGTKKHKPSAWKRERASERR